MLVIKDMDVKEHERLYNFTLLRHKLKKRNIAFIAVLHFSHRRVLTRTLKWVWNGPNCKYWIETQPDVQTNNLNSSCLEEGT